MKCFLSWLTRWNKTKSLVFPKNATFGDTLGFAVRVTNQKQADVVIEALIELSIKYGLSRDKALKVNAQNLDEYINYYSESVRQRVRRLYAELLKHRADQ